MKSESEIKFLDSLMNSQLNLDDDDSKQKYVASTRNFSLFSVEDSSLK